MTKKQAHGYKQLSPEEYNQIKTLSEISGIKRKQLVTITGRSIATIAYIVRSKSFEDYKAIQAEVLARKTRPNSTDYPKPVTNIPANGDYSVKRGEDGQAVVTPVAPRSLEERNARSMERMAFALEQLVVAWRNKPEDAPKKRSGIFG